MEEYPRDLCNIGLVKDPALEASGDIGIKLAQVVVGEKTCTQCGNGRDDMTLRDVIEAGLGHIEGSYEKTDELLELIGRHAYNIVKFG